MFRNPRINRERLFQTRPPKGYEYQPRFYDPEKERLDALKRRAGEEELVDGELVAGNNIRAGNMRRRRSQKGARWGYLLRLIIILAILVLMLWWLENSLTL